MGALLADGLVPPREEVGEPRCEVVREIYTDGLVNDSSVIGKIKGYSLKQHLNKCFVCPGDCV